jgi:hypothetical protein
LFTFFKVRCFIVIYRGELRIGKKAKIPQENIEENDNVAKHFMVIKFNSA